VKRVTNSSNLTYHRTSQFETTTDPKALKALLVWFDQFQTAPIPHKIWLQCQLALTEGFTNAIRHAHAGLASDTPIRIEVTVSENDIDMRIWDQGPGFSFDSMLDNKLSVNRQDAEGGRGLKIMYLVADELSYEPLDGQGNCLHIHKTYQ
jgi:serine/threonine-protein kinase RsbW